MYIINIYKSKEYFHCLIYFIFEIFSFILFSDYIFDINIYYINLFLLSTLFIYYLICIFLESEFDSEFLQEIQICLDKAIYFISIICLITSAMIFCYYSLFIRYFYIYKLDCPFSMIDVNYKLHLKKRCELYNINMKNSSLHRYQYICSFNAEKYDPTLFFLLMNKKNITSFSDRRCSKVETLITDNKIINEFVNEYYKEEALYYCDLVYEPKIYPSINPKKCDSKIFFYPELLIILHFYLSGKYLKLFVFYFKNIRANVNRVLY